MVKSKPNLHWIGHTIGGRYKIEALLGQGGMSSVYKATDPNLRRAVAIKLIHPHLSSDPQFVRRFEQEAAAVAQLRHPNIIQVHDFNHDDDLYYMVLEFVPGQTLQQKLKTVNSANQRLSLAQTIQIITTICEAVAYAHEQGMIHRDLKPANVMLTPGDQPILMDFGVAKMLSGTQHTATGAIIGTAKYMSPEQARGERPDERTDIYSLGVMLYEMIAGQPPFEADSTVAILMKHATQPVPDIRQLQSDTPDGLVAVVEKALAKDPADRYQTAAEMAAALKKAVGLPAPAMISADYTQAASAEQWPNGKPIPASPSLAPAAQPTQSGRPPIWLIGLAAVLLILLLGAGFFFITSGSDQSSTQTDAQAAAMAEDQTLPSSEGMVQIDSGTYTVGLDPSDKDHAATQRIELAEFWLDQYEVTNAEYAQFLTETGHEPPADWPEENIPADQADHPVKGVTWEMAAAYCEWAGKRLPTEAEWEVSARGPEGRLYPWGDDQRAVELPRSGTYDVGGKPTNQSAFGVFDMAGNVWEWVGETYTPVEQDDHRVLRGGANGFLKDMAYRLQGDPNVPTVFATAGLRCAAEQVNVVQIEDIQDESVLYQDSFADPGSGWPVLAEGTYYFGYHPPDYYHIEIGVPNDYTVISRPPAVEDVTVEAEVVVDHTDTEQGDFRYGLVLRRSSEDQYYAFTVSSRSGVWQVLKSSPAGLETLAEGTVDTLRGFAPAGFTPDKQDALRVDASGAEFVFYINGQPVTAVSDPDYASGEIGFFVETFDETLTHVHYDSLVIRETELKR